MGLGTEESKILGSGGRFSHCNTLQPHPVGPRVLGTKERELNVGSLAVFKDAPRNPEILQSPKEETEGGKEARREERKERKRNNSQIII